MNPNSVSRIRRLFLMLIAVLLLHSVAMVVFEKMSWGQSLWLSLTTATTVGYGDISAASGYGQFATAILMYIIGISLLAQLASEYFEYRIEMRDRKIKGLWIWKSMKNHILIINTPKLSGERYFKRLIDQILQTPDLQNLPVQIITTRFPNGLPQTLQDNGVVHRHGRALQEQVLLDANIADAKYIFVVARDEDNMESDSLTLDILERIRAHQTKARIIVEAIDDNNRIRFKRFGAHSTLRPIRAYPELVVRAMAAPGSEEVLENMFTHQGDFARRIDVEVKVASWREVIEKIIRLDVGLPLGFIDNNNCVVTNPGMNQAVDMKALLLLTSDLESSDEENIKMTLVK